MVGEAKVIKAITDARKTFQKVMRQEQRALGQGDSFEFDVYPQEWKISWEKGQRALELADDIKDRGYFTTSIELCFYTLERTFEALIMKLKGIRGFRAKHGEVFDLALEYGLVSERLAFELGILWRMYRAEQYYRPYVPSEHSAKQMIEAAKIIAQFVEERL